MFLRFIMCILNHFSKPTARRLRYKIHLCLCCQCAHRSTLLLICSIEIFCCVGTRWLNCLVCPLICRYRIPCSKLGFWEQQTWKFFSFLRTWNTNRLTGPYLYVVPCGIVNMEPIRVVHICIVSEFLLSDPLIWRFPMNAKNEIKDNYPSQQPVGMVSIWL